MNRLSLIAISLLALSAFVAQPAGSRTQVGDMAATRNGACTAAATMVLVRTFVREYSKGQVAAIDRLWAPEPRFQWFSTGPPGARLGPRAYNRATLSAYFHARVRVHERLRLRVLRAGYDAQRKLVNFNGKLIRSADDLKAGPPHDFKGAADCNSGKPTLIVWSM